MSSLLQPPLNAIPEGILSLLGIKNGGQNPQHLGGNLAPVVDLAAWYAQSQAEVVSVSDQIFDGVINSPVLLGIPVPANEWWWVHNVEGRASQATLLTNQAQITLQLTALFRRGTDTSLVLPTLASGLPGGVFPSGGGTGRNTSVSYSGPSFLLSPNSQLFNQYWGEVDGVPDTLNIHLRARVTRMRG